MRFEAGSVFAGYTVVSRLGRGGMATVYRVREPGIDRLVALKVLPEQLVDEEQFSARFKQEARLIGSLDHPNIIPLYRYGITDDIPWMALRYVDGGDFAARLAARPLPLPEGLSILRGVAAALDYAHQMGVIHRDLKPQNILLTHHGAYLADFGVAKMLEGTTGANTAAGDILGSPSYMAPEQAQGLRLGPYTDVYALAVICFQWLTGALPFDADTPHAILLKHIKEPLPTEALGLVAPNVAAVLERGLAKQPELRFQSASALIDALEQTLNCASTLLIGTPIQPVLVPQRMSNSASPERDCEIAPTPPLPDLPASPALRSNRRWNVVGLLVLVLGLAIGGYFYWRQAMQAEFAQHVPADRNDVSPLPAARKKSGESVSKTTMSVRLGCQRDVGRNASDSADLLFWDPKDNGGKPLCVLNREYLTSNDVESVHAGVDEVTGSPILNLTFKPEGAQRLTALTSANLDRELVYVLDEKVLIAATIRAPVGGEVQVTGLDSQQTQTIASRIEQQLNSQ